MDKRQYDVEVAIEVGIQASVFLDSIRRWIEHNAANRQNFKNGKYWTYNSAKAWSELFPEFSIDQIKRTIKKLKDAELIEIDSFNMMGFDHTSWYALTPKALNLLYGPNNIPYALEGKWMERNRTIDGAKSHYPFVEIAPTIPSINTSINTSICVDTPKKAKAKFVPPTLEEVKKYAKSRNSNVDVKAFFDFYDVAHWVDSKGQPVKNWKQKFITWDNADKKNGRNNPAPQPPKVDLQGYTIDEEYHPLMDELMGEDDGK